MCSLDIDTVLVDCDTKAGGAAALSSPTLACVASQRSNDSVVVVEVGAAQNEVLPGFEPGSLDSESRVLTITP